MEIFDHKFSKVYIKWHKKLHIDIESIENLSSKKSQPDLPRLHLLLQIAKNSIHHINIPRYISPSQTVAFKYENHSIYARSENFDFNASLEYKESHIFIPDLTLSLKNKNLYLQGEVRLHDKHNHIEMLALALVDRDRKIDLFVDIKRGRVELTANSNAVSDLRFITRFIDIPDNVQPWMFDKLQATSFKLNSFSSNFAFNKPHQFLENLKAKAKVENVSYQFNPKLYPIVAPSALVSYENHHLNIEPDQATYANHPITNTLVELKDLNNNPKLGLSFHTKELVDKAFLGIIEHYLQKVPLEQFSGNNSIDFNLEYDFTSQKTSIQSDVKVKDARLSINNYPVNIYDATVHLKNNNLTIDYAKFQSFKALDTSFSGQLNLKTLLGDIKVYVSQFDTALIKLLTDFTMHFKFQKDGILIHNSNSNWKLLNSMQFLAGKHSMFIDKNHTLSVKNIHLYTPGIFEASIAGQLSLNNKLKQNTLALHFKELTALLANNKTLQLEHPFDIKVAKENSRHFETSRSIVFSHDDKPISLDSITFNMNDKLTLDIHDFRFKDAFQSDFNFNYDSKKKKGAISLDNLNANIQLTKPQLLKIKKNKIRFDIEAADHLLVHEKDLNISYSLNKTLHQFTVHDLTKLYPYSPFFQKYDIKQGRTTFITRDLERFNIFTTLNYFPIPGYINNDTNETIFLASTYDKEGFKTVINNAIKVHWDKSLTLDIENTNLDLQPFLEPSSDANEKMIPININAKEGYLKLAQKEKILYSTLHASINDTIIKASLNHKGGEALLALQDQHIEIYGEKFSDSFIRSLINFDGLEGGSYNFFIKGDNKKLLGGIELKESTFKGFALYNNILSFLNTIPALVTFNDPGFNADGFKVKDGKIQFEKNNGIVNIKSIKLKGNASNILGSGSVDLKENTINLTLRIFLLKDMGKILSSVPIAGYLLLGEDGSLTTTITIKGTLDKPDISIDLGTDILMAPVNIIKRTLLAPVRFFDWITGNEKNSGDAF